MKNLKKDSYIVSVVLLALRLLWFGWLIHRVFIKFWVTRGESFGYYEFAIEHYSRAIHLDGKRSGAFNSRGVTRYYQGQYDEAVKDYDRAIEIDRSMRSQSRIVLSLSSPSVKERKLRETMHSPANWDAARTSLVGVQS